MVVALLIPFALLAVAMAFAPARPSSASPSCANLFPANWVGGLLDLDEDARLAVFLTFAGVVGIAALSLV